MDMSVSILDETSVQVSLQQEIVTILTLIYSSHSFFSQEAQTPSAPISTFTLKKWISVQEKSCLTVQ